jgi:TfoX/Sxy family transcriptional regulator of competence genes
MKSTNEFADYAVESCATLGRVACRRMFGGYGLYCYGTMFALIGKDVVYLKVDATSRREFERAGATLSVYGARRKRIVMSCDRAPADRPGVARHRSRPAAPPPVAIWQAFAHTSPRTGGVDSRNRGTGRRAFWAHASQRIA